MSRSSVPHQECQPTTHGEDCQWKSIPWHCLDKTDGVDSEAWRYTGPFSRFNRFKSAFPGLGIATGAFAVYLVAEQLFFKEEHHGEEHH
jgi:hypothetical protein